MVKKSRGGQTVNSSQKRRQSYLRRKKIGAVLIEFAFAIPVFLVLIYYIHDLPKLKLMNRKMQFTANIMAATLQNIAKQKAGTGNPKITQTDIKNAARLAYLAVFPGMTQYGTGTSGYGETVAPLGYYSFFNIYYLTGIGNNVGRITWGITGCAGNPALGSDRAAKTREITEEQHEMTSVNTTSREVSYSGLVIGAGENKILLECALVYLWNVSGRYFSDGRRVIDVPIKDAFGFLFATPTKHSQRQWNFFPGITIFTPIGSAFGDTLPAVK